MLVSSFVPLCPGEPAMQGVHPLGQVWAKSPALLPSVGIHQEQVLQGLCHTLAQGVRGKS